MICVPCRERRHDECRGGSWCYCQHQRGPATEKERDRDRRDRAEPKVNWKRQG
ncbi:hypothetical protein [Actinomadura hibisca]|uniref:hypothetical protein n=1 Tax=Actinomadura hibisca TaxID=68565 RepID=UPI0012FA53C9|nr:hypothetical protein [Actinomadura hibisca]